MPEFIVKRWYRSAIAIAITLLFFLLSVYHWIFYLIGCIASLLLIWTLFLIEQQFRKAFHRYILTLTRRINRGKQFAIHHFPVGIILYNQEKKIEWHNSFFHSIFGQKNVVGLGLSEVFPDLKQEKQFQWTYQDTVYQVTHVPEQKVYYFQEITKEIEWSNKYEQEQTVLGYIYLDNLEEVTQGLTEQDETLLVNQVYSKISSWALQHGLALNDMMRIRSFLLQGKKNWNYS